jgi:phosphoenolpyruvate-protein kinase (PTS system EI component)
MKYAIQAKSAEHAMDELTMTEHNRHFEELTQKWLGEQILDIREVTPHELETLMKSLSQDESELCSHWMGKELIHKVQYED